MTYQIIHAQWMLTDMGWRENSHLVVDASGYIDSIGDGASNGAINVDVLLPAPANLHSHSFQRAMAGLTEHRGSAQNDDFWSWRDVMYRFLEILGPEDIEAIAAQVQMEMLEAGYASVGEFHYLHHQHAGVQYDNPAELSLRILSAAIETGIGLTHLPVLYMRGGLDDRQLQGGQLRFGNSLENFALIHENIKAALKACPDDFVLGVAPHSLRAVDQKGLFLSEKLAGAAPLHIHIAEQTKEIEEVEAALGAWPVRWLLDNISVNERWCLVHATHMSQGEVFELAKSDAIAGLCPITEANLGDGVFNAPDYLAAGGKYGVGSDSNLRISLSEELRMLEYSQRLTHRRRNVIADATRSCGRCLYEDAAAGGAQALGRKSGRIQAGYLADLTALNAAYFSPQTHSGDTLLDEWIFAKDDENVSDVWSAGRHVVRDGKHVKRDAVKKRFDNIMKKLRAM
ncbi:formimidoylglutamate deiminase [Hyphococcus sp.]|uniref:formimidoylglutamate deiminase n=1 Tax=Hyphococcus sp. TaxID=2038636 RepID=UPI003CCC05EF